VRSELPSIEARRTESEGGVLEEGHVASPFPTSYKGAEGAL